MNLFRVSSLLSLAAAAPSTGKISSIIFLYGCAAVLSLLILVGYLVFVSKKDKLFLLLFSAVLVINCGYFALSVSQSLAQALWANRAAYLGSVFLPLLMLLIILKAVRLPYPRQLPAILASIGGIIFLITASPGLLPIYYREVSLAVVGGVTTLQKVYGPLHLMYGIYLLFCFAAMVAIIIYACLKKLVDELGHAVILLIAVFVNLGVWFIEQRVRLDFEFLSISYIISELFLLGLHLILLDVERARAHDPYEEAMQYLKPGPPLQVPVSTQPVDLSEDRYARYLNGAKTFTPTEKTIFDAYIARLTTAEIMAAMNITENTLKFHNKNLYNKLGVTSRKELQEIYSIITAQRKL